MLKFISPLLRIILKLIYVSSFLYYIFFFMHHFFFLLIFRPYKHGTFSSLKLNLYFLLLLLIIYLLSFSKKTRLRQKIKLNTFQNNILSIITIYTTSNLEILDLTDPPIPPKTKTFV